MTYSKSELLDHLTEVAEDGVAPTQIELDAAEGPCAQTYKNHFGSYLNAVEAAGLQRAQNPGAGDKKYSDDELLSWIEAFHNEFGVVPRRPDFKGDSPTPCLSTYEDRFGSWSEALREAGFEPSANQKAGTGGQQ